QRRQRDAAAAAKSAVPAIALRDRQSATDMVLSPDSTHVFVVVEEKAAGAKRSDVAAFVTESAYVEMIAGRPHVGEPRDHAQLMVLDLRTGKSVAASERFGCGSAPGADAPAGCKQLRWHAPAFSSDGRFAVAAAVSVDNKDRWLLSIDADSGATQVLDHRHDPAWVEESEAAGRVF